MAAERQISPGKVQGFGNGADQLSVSNPDSPDLPNPRIITVYIDDPNVESVIIRRRKTDRSKTIYITANPSTEIRVEGAYVS